MIVSSACPTRSINLCSMASKDELEDPQELRTYQQTWGQINREKESQHTEKQGDTEGWCSVTDCSMERLRKELVSLMPVYLCQQLQNHRRSRLSCM